MIRAVFDTNVLVSARLSLLGNPARCLALANLRQIESITCQPILDEFVEKLISKFEYEQSRAAEAAEQVRKISRLVELGETPRLVPDDADDDKIVQCALVGGTSHIVSGDKHLLALKTYKDIFIVRPADFLSLVAEADFD
jgi:putative PIN family toxin of toxin-antitoxin system